jgi:hypothetical protein
MQQLTQRRLQFRPDEMIVRHPVQSREQRRIAAHHQHSAIAAIVTWHAAVGEVFVLCRRVHELDRDEGGVLDGLAGVWMVRLEAGWRGVVEVGEVDGTVGP